MHGRYVRASFPPWSVKSSSSLCMPVYIYGVCECTSPFRGCGVLSVPSRERSTTLNCAWLSEVLCIVQSSERQNEGPEEKRKGMIRTPSSKRPRKEKFVYSREHEECASLAGRPSPVSAEPTAAYIDSQLSSCLLRSCLRTCVYAPQAVLPLSCPLYVYISAGADVLLPPRNIFFRKMSR